jgi:two-component system alkaline phosphatase synthesis response regulator PhoP
LISKIKALLRRQTALNYKNIAEVIKVGELIINRETYQVVYRGKDLVLPRKEFELLSLLVSKPGKVYKRDEILDRVWGNDVVVGGRTIDVHIRKLRKKFGDDSFKTVKGVGYKFAS